MMSNFIHVRPFGGTVVRRALVLLMASGMLSIAPAAKAQTTEIADGPGTVEAVSPWLGADVYLEPPSPEIENANALFHQETDPVDESVVVEESAALEETPELEQDAVATDALSFRAAPAQPTPIDERGNKRYVLPVDKIYISAGDVSSPHHDYPAWDIGVPLGTPVYSVTSGVVAEATYDGNCGAGVKINGSDGMTYLYCHGSAIATAVGRSVRPGELIMLSGDSGHSTAPHLHLQIENASGVLVCPQTPLASWYSGGQMSPALAPTSGCWYPGTGEDDALDGGAPAHIGGGDPPSIADPTDPVDPTDPDPSVSPEPSPSDGGVTPSPSPTSSDTPGPDPQPSDTPSEEPSSAPPDVTLPPTDTTEPPPTPGGDPSP
ncbi:MAG: hypothetical protein QOH90_1047 [Actinomycetota bacterium]|nr:hypothetical protein [Actinomycetota bacterium]